MLHRDGDYAKPNIKGRSHATKHHYVAERFFGRSSNREASKGIPYLNHALGIMRARLLFTVMSAMKNYYIIQYYYRKTFNFSKS